MGGFLLAQDALARLALEKFGRPDIALLLNRGDAKLAMFLGNYYFNGTLGRSEYNLDKAERAYQKATAVRPGILWGHYQLARIYFIKGQLEKALEEINKELEANPENLRSLYVRGLIYGYSGNLDKAEADFRRFTEWAPKEWAGYNDLAWILSKRSKYREAKEAAMRGIDEAQDGRENPWLWNARGVAELNLGEYKEAKTSFAKAKALAEKLSENDWRRAYPGNNPQNAGLGLKAFREAIEENLRRATVAAKSM
jgi:tetratricopeptide (TPR) repeat protein